LGSHIPKQRANDYISGDFLLLDLTDRGNYCDIVDMQALAKKDSLSWDLSKGQDNFCPVSPFIPAKDIKDTYALELHLQINCKTVQRDINGNMHYKIDDIIEYVSKFMTLNEGDLILMGTPNGIGPVNVGDKIEG
jgi:2-keto-4-pentenoate hydratase/2-oxohepta-3-ene-1,7-dioic acid hydratase in catechol pathway